MIRILTGDCRAILPTLESESVNCIVTSPPYWGLRSYVPDGHPKKHLEIGSERTVEDWVQTLVEVFRECRRVLRKDGLLFVNLGDSYAGSRCGGDTGKSGLEGSTQSQDESKRAKKQHQAFTGEQKEASAAAKRAMVSSRRRDNHEIPRSDLRMDGYKAKDLVGQPWMLAFALRADGWFLRQDVVWCLSGGASVYARTQKGDMPVMVKDLVRLRPETVKLWNGTKWTQALGWSRSTDTEGALEIELRSGERIGCTHGHQWPTVRGLLRADELRAGDVIDTCRLPEPERPRVCDALGLDVAWLCGLYLAEGSMSGSTVQLAGHADETSYRMERIERVAASFHGSVRAHLTVGKSATINIDGPVIQSVIQAYVHGNTAHNKGIKVRAWARPDAWLSQFLHGYLDGDGHWDAENERWRLGFCRNDRLADDLRTLAARLGLPIRLLATTGSGFGKEWPIYRGDLRTVPTTHANARKGGEVVMVRASRARQFWDIGVEDDPNTFALASGVLTHNSKANPMPESVRDRCTKAHEYIFMLSKSGRPTIWHDRVSGDWLSKLTKDQKAETIMLERHGAEPILKKRWRACDYYYDFDAVQEAVNGNSHPRGPGNVKPLKGVGDDFQPQDETLRTRVGLLAYANRQKAKMHDSAAARIERARASHKSAPDLLHNGIRSREKVPSGWDQGDGTHGSYHPDGRARGVNPKAALADSYNDSTSAPQGAYASGKSEKLGRAPGWRGTKQNPSFSAALGAADLVEKRNPRSVWEATEEEFLQFLAWREQQVVVPDVWDMPTHPFKGAHFATFPLELAKRCILAGCPPGGVVLDLFGGSGTVGLVADQLQRDAILIDLDERNAPMAVERISKDAPLLTEFAA